MSCELEPDIDIYIGHDYSTHNSGDNDQRRHHSKKSSYKYYVDVLETTTPTRNYLMNCLLVFRGVVVVFVFDESIIICYGLIIDRSSAKTIDV